MVKMSDEDSTKGGHEEMSCDRYEVPHVELNIPEEMKALMVTYRSVAKCRDVSIASYFRAKRAIYYAEVAERARLDFWIAAKRLYPILCHGDWFYNFDDEVIIKGRAGQDKKETSDD